jgi:hypothetical protein
MSIFAAAIKLLGSITRDNIGNMWFLSNNPDIANFQTGAKRASHQTVLSFTQSEQTHQA